MSENLEAINNARYLGMKFYQEGMEQLENVAYDETMYKTAQLVGMIGGFAVLAAGVPGGVKSQVALNSYRLIKGVSSEDVAFIPSSMTMTEDSMVGGRLESHKMIVHTHPDKTKEEIEESSQVNIEGLIQPDTKVIVLDEVSRMNPYALNSLLRVLNERQISSSAGQHNMDKLIYAVSTLNPSESRESTLPLYGLPGGFLVNSNTWYGVM